MWTSAAHYAAAIAEHETKLTLPSSPTVPRSETRPVVYFTPPAFGRLRPLAELARLPRFFDLLWTLSVHRVKVRYKQSRLGILWAVLQPLAMMLVFTLMLSFFGGAPNQG